MLLFNLNLKFYFILINLLVCINASKDKTLKSCQDSKAKEIDLKSIPNVS